MLKQPQQFASIVTAPLAPDGSSRRVITQLGADNGDQLGVNNDDNILVCDNTKCGNNIRRSTAKDYRRRFRVKGMLDGNLYSKWSLSDTITGQQNRTITAELPIRLSNEKVFSSNCIESDTELRLEPLEGYLTLRARGRSADDGAIESSYLTAEHGRLELSSQQLSIETVYSSLPGEQTNGPINNNNNNSNNKIATEMINLTRYRTTDPRHKSDDNNNNQQQQQARSHRKEMVFKFDAKQKLVVLNDLNSLNDNNFRRPTSAIKINGELHVGHAGIMGSPDTNLELQARNGDLNCRGNDMLRLISKTADIRLVAGSRLQTRSSKLVFNSNKGLYLKHLAVANNRLGDEIVPIQRQSLPTASFVVDGSSGGGDEEHLQFAATNAAPAESFSIEEKKQKQEQEQPPATTTHTTATKQHEQNSLQAYELIIVNGLLMAA